MLWPQRRLPDGPHETLLPVFHVAYGLQIAVNGSLPGIPIGPEPKVSDVRIRLKSDTVFPSPLVISAQDLVYTSPNRDDKGQPTLRVGKLDGGKYFGFFYSDGARFAVDREGREVWADWPDNFTLADACTYLMGPIIAFVLRLRGITCLHASAVVVDGRAIALFGLAGAGKSTTAAAFALSGIAVLSDDVAVLADRGDHFFIQPGYPRVNLWPDSVRTLFGSEDALPRITPSWDKRYLPLDQDGRRFESHPLPLGAIYILDEREEGLAAPVVEDVVGCEAFRTVVANTYVNYLLDADMRASEFEVLGRVLAGVPLRRVRPTTDPTKVFALCDAILADAKQLASRESTNAVPGSALGGDRSTLVRPR
jgi:hypothetical protein